MKDPVRQKIARYELGALIDPAHFYSTLDEAVENYIHNTGTAWAVWP
jgi:hypothetical protein